MEIVPRSAAAPTPELGPRTKRRPQAWRLGALALAAALAVLAWRAHTVREHGLRAVLEKASAVGLDAASLAAAEREARREADLAGARLAVAGALLERELLTREVESEESFARLATARELAADALRDRPASHEAAMILGATIEVERSRRRDTRLFSLAEHWERPLEAAIALAPGSPRPRHLLAAAYLDVWPALSPAKRERAGELLREAFRDPAMFERLFDPWVAIAGSLDRAAELLPDDPRSWERLANVAYSRGLWRDYSELTSRRRGALRRDREALLDRIAEARGNGAGIAAIGEREIAMLLAVPIDAEFAPLVDRALSLRPPGAANQAEAGLARAWFEWAMPLCLVRECPLAAESIARLVSLAGTELTIEQIAFAALAAGDDAKAALLERRSDSLWSEAWAPYLTLRAKRLATAGDRAGAVAALNRAHRAFRARTSFRVIVEQLRRAGSTTIDPLTAGTAPAARSAWEASEWWFDRGASRLDLLPERSAAAIVLEPPMPPANGALLELQWDGVRMPPVWFAPGATTVRLAVGGAGSSPNGVSAEPHLLECRLLWGDLRPAMRVRLD